MVIKGLIKVHYKERRVFSSSTSSSWFVVMERAKSPLEQELQMFSPVEEDKRFDFLLRRPSAIRESNYEV